MKENIEQINSQTPQQVVGCFNLSHNTGRCWTKNDFVNASKTPKKPASEQIDSNIDFSVDNHIDSNSSLAKQRVLIIDDEEGVRDTLIDLLEDLDGVEGCAVCEDGLAASLKIHSYKPTTILLDVALPGLDGVKVCKMIKNDPRTAHIRIIAMSGNASDEKIKRILDYGAESFIRKPINLAMLAKEFN